MPTTSRWRSRPRRTLGRACGAAGTLEPLVAAAVGRALGEFHAEGGDPGDDAPALGSGCAGGVAFDRPGPGHLRLLSAGGVKLLESLQRSDGMLSRLAAIDPPRGDQLVHGDMRWENVLVGAADGAAHHVWLVDWEMGGAGEHEWDAGCFAAAAVSAWLTSMPEVPEAPLERLAPEATVPLEALAPGLDLFWSAYRAAVPQSAGDPWAERCAQLAAVRLVHIAFEVTLLDLGLRAAAVAHLQVASNILEDPGGPGATS